MIIKLLLFLSLIFGSYYCKEVVLNVDPSVPQYDNCGLESEMPCRSIKEALEQITRISTPFSKIIMVLEKSRYFGYLNREIEIKDLVIEIKTKEAREQSIIDCENISYGFSLLQSNVTMQGLVLLNCESMKGGAIISYTSNLDVIDSSFYKNIAYLGGAIYFDGFNNIYNFNCYGCSFISNIAFDKGAAIYSIAGHHSLSNSKIACNFGTDIVSLGSIIYIKKSNISASSITCTDPPNNSSTMYTSSGYWSDAVNVCDQVVASCSLNTPTIDDILRPVTNQSSGPSKVKCNNNGVCDPQESCLTCPSDCSCQFNGAKFELYSNCPVVNNKTVTSESCLVDGYPMPLKVISFNNLYTHSSSYGIIFNYFKVDIDSNYRFVIKGNNIGTVISLNRLIIIDASFIVENLTQTHEIRITPSSVNFLKIEIFTLPLSFSSLEVVLLDKNGFNVLNPYFSYKVCNDGINDNETLCHFDQDKIHPHYGPECGDGQCNEFPSTCIQDCYEYIGTKCSSQIEPIKNNFPILDSVGYLLNNQYSYSLPGLSHMAHGIDIKTGEEVPSIIFDFGYCPNASYSTLQDFYRGKVYSIPNEFYANIAPKCAYQSESRVYDSATMKQREFSKETSLEVSFNLNGKFGGYGATVSAAYSQSESSKQSSKLEKANGGKTISTKYKCVITTVSRNSIRFHTNFIEKLSQSIDLSSMLNFVKKFGQFYYKSSSLGGSLEVITNVQTSKISASNEEELKKSSEISASVDISTPYGGGGGSYTGTKENSVSLEQQQTFEKSSTKGHLIVKGGSPGSFGPDYNAPSSYGSWAMTVDTRPVPIDFKLDLLFNIIPENWNLKNPINMTDVENGNNVTISTYRELWWQAYMTYIKEDPQEETNRLINKVTLTFSYQTSSARKNLTIEERFMLSNLSVVLNNIAEGISEDNTNYTISNINLSNYHDCSKDGCQYIIKKDAPVGLWEIGSINISYWDVGNQTLLPLNATLYVDELIIHVYTHEYSRGYIFKPKIIPIYGPDPNATTTTTGTPTTTTTTTGTNPTTTTITTGTPTTTTTSGGSTTSSTTTSDSSTTSTGSIPTTTTSSTTTTTTGSGGSVPNIIGYDTLQPIPPTYPEKGSMNIYLTISSSKKEGVNPYLLLIGSQGTKTIYPTFNGTQFSYSLIKDIPNIEELIEYTLDDQDTPLTKEEMFEQFSSQILTPQKITPIYLSSIKYTYNVTYAQKINDIHLTGLQYYSYSQSNFGTPDEVIALWVCDEKDPSTYGSCFPSGQSNKLGYINMVTTESSKQLTDRSDLYLDFSTYPSDWINVVAGQCTA